MGKFSLGYLSNTTNTNEKTIFIDFEHFFAFANKIVYLLLLSFTLIAYWLYIKSS
jgi:hypothetical protein